MKTPFLFNKKQIHHTKNSNHKLNRSFYLILRTCKTNLYILPIFLISILPTTSLFSKTIFVCTNCTIKTLKDAITLSQNGDTIKIQPGIYKEGFLPITKSISIIGENGVVIDGLKEKHVLGVYANGVRIQNLKVIGSGISDLSEFAGVHTEKVKDCYFENLSLEDNVYGFYLAETTNCTLKNNTSIGNAENEVLGGNGIHLWSASQNKIIGNKLKKHRDGIYLEFSEHLEIEGNESEENIRYGMHFMFSNHNQFNKNIFKNNSAGVAVMYSKDITMEENKFLDNWGESSNGILLKDIADSTLSKNRFEGNTIAVFADGITNINFQNNDFINNGWGIKILGNTDYNKIIDNNFIKNVFDISTNTKSTTNIFSKNYWDHYEGYDLDKDQIGDIPHKTIHFFGYWIAVYPFLMVLYESPVVLFLQGIEKAFPIVTPIEFEDQHPRMKERI
ncbi:nitrous oxide reductase family maturation protein NosD [Leptospira sp. 2 VSF19]|uniref:Nitrous oxide reductase family maturation protein NosD n=1 Tax=Leptospira soteropolitanensis TaxID=2950025 RepID=A0AAW5VIT4_9LEPT|nr:nitrous oxide reductase family maturation protein NosD [Leptospira soteropolitanensis]MCW7491909.1 nitrous oxide reductase family maturation protein NosD [Leptospira soteropolitanensis]MCW7499493.1 nitrous oxide reductase family maturation protein NosD [Leptospira soteropolitanensis]MCW7520916.1 nitrous oxide reductase family maturation protein NosD [Leptospira soteropolitanensis]MCW7525597.1 nitrous oxide reductase family maturation protein NosD [Leptospira soteropolitanensis]MCW7529463.1 